jgi:hypothetical protein
MILTMLAALALEMPQDRTAQEKTTTPEKTVARLLNATHGLTALSGPEVAVLLERIRRDPEPYLPYLLKQFDVDMLSATGDATILMRAENAAEVLVQAGGDQGRAALASKLGDLYSSSDRLQAQIDVEIRAYQSREVKSARDRSELIASGVKQDRIIRVERAVVGEFTRARDQRLKDRILERLDREDYSTQLIYVRYLEQTSLDDERVRQRLERMRGTTP